MPDNSNRDKRIEEAIAKNLRGKAFDDFVYGEGKAPGIDDTPPAILPKALPGEKRKLAKKRKVKIVRPAGKRTVKKVVPMKGERKAIPKPVIGSKKELEEARKKRLIKMRRREQ